MELMLKHWPKGQPHPIIDVKNIRAFTKEIEATGATLEEALYRWAILANGPDGLYNEVINAYESCKK